MSDVDIADAIDSASLLANALMRMADGMGRGRDNGSIAEIAHLIDEKLDAIRDALVARQDAEIAAEKRR